MGMEMLPQMAPPDAYNTAITGLQQLNQIRQTNLANQASAIKNQYLTPMMQSQLALSRARVPLLQAQTGLQQAQIPLTQAKTVALPMQTSINEQMALNKLAGIQEADSPLARASKIARVIRSLPSTYKDTFTAGHIPFMSNLAGSAGAALNAPGIQVQNVLSTPARSASSYAAAQPQTSQTAQPTLGSITGSQPYAQQPAQQPYAQQTAQQPVQQTVQQTVQQPASAYSTQAQQVIEEQAAQREVNKKQVSPALWNRYNQAKSFDITLRTPAMQKAFQTIAKFSNVLDQSRAYINSQFGGSTYADIESAKKQALPIISGGIKYLEGLPTSTEGINVGLSYFNKAKTLWNSNPKSAMKFLQNGLNMLHSETTGLYTAAQPSYMVDKIPPRIVLDPSASAQQSPAGPDANGNFPNRAAGLAWKAQASLSDIAAYRKKWG